MIRVAERFKSSTIEDEATVERTKKVQRDAAPEVVTAVEAGDLTLSAALPLTELPKEEQPKVLEAVLAKT